MKKFVEVLFTIVLVATLGLTSGCRSDDPDNPEGGEKPRLYNEADSLSMCEVLKNVDGGYWGKETEEMLKHPADWKNVIWRWMEDEQQYRIVEVLLGVESTTSKSYVHPAIGDLTHLEGLWVNGPGFWGALPSTVCNLENLIALRIESTNMSVIPDEIFSERMVYVLIEMNPLLREVPSSVKNLKTRNYTWKDCELFSFYNNGFQGRCPVVKNANVNFRSNEFSAIDWESAGGECHSVTKGVSGPEDRTLSFFNYNPFEKCEIPEDVMTKLCSDTISLLLLYDQVVGFHLDDVPYTNMPDSDEIIRLKSEWYGNHPECRADYVEETEVSRALKQTLPAYTFSVME